MDYFKGMFHLILAVCILYVLSHCELLVRLCHLRPTIANEMCVIDSFPSIVLYKTAVGLFGFAAFPSALVTYLFLS